MTDDTRLVAAGLSMLAMLIAGCGGDDPISPTAPSATLPAGAAPPGQTAPTVSALGETGALKTGETIGVDAEDAATSVAVSGVHTTINLRGIAWQRNAYNNKLIPDDATDSEGGGSASVSRTNPSVTTTHVWVRSNGTGLGVVDSTKDLTGASLNYGGGMRYTLTRRRQGRYVANISASNVESIESQTSDPPVPKEPKGGGGRRDTGCITNQVIQTSTGTTISPTGGLIKVGKESTTYRVDFYVVNSISCGTLGLNPEDLVKIDSGGAWLTLGTGTIQKGDSHVLFSVSENTDTYAREADIRLLSLDEDDFHSWRIQQRGTATDHPQVTLECSPSCSLIGTGETVTLTANTIVPGGGTLTYAWTATYGTISGSRTTRTTTWVAPSTTREGQIKVAVTSDEATVTRSVSITVVTRCRIALSGIVTGYGTNEGDGRSFTSAASNGKLYYNVANYGGPACAAQRFFTGMNWVRATGPPASATAETNRAWDYYIPFAVDANTSTTVREARIGLVGSSDRTVFWQAGARRTPTPTTCSTSPITHSRTSWTVGIRYYGSGFTQPWAKMGYGQAGGCRTNGLPLSQPGRVQVCGYSVHDANAPAACRAAPRPTHATSTTDPSVGAVVYITSSGSYTPTSTGSTPAAQWVEFLVQESTTSGTLSLEAGTSPTGETVYLHFGYEHESDLSYGDSDYERWNVGTPTWTFSPAASTTSGSAVTHPTLTEHGRYPGVFLVTCAASNGRPTGSDTNADTDDGFSVRVSAAQGSPSVTYTASAAHPTYPRICKP